MKLLLNASEREIAYPSLRNREGSGDEMREKKKKGQVPFLTANRIGQTDVIVEDYESSNSLRKVWWQKNNTRYRKHVLIQSYIAKHRKTTIQF